MYHRLEIKSTDVSSSVCHIVIVNRSSEVLVVMAEYWLATDMWNY
jgi:hypothetical protein